MIAGEGTVLKSDIIAGEIQSVVIITHIIDQIVVFNGTLCQLVQETGSTVIGVQRNRGGGNGRILSQCVGFNAYIYGVFNNLVEVVVSDDF